MTENIKQVIVMRSDLGMRKGKMISQACHASMSFLTKKIQASEKLSKVEKTWVEGSFTKICVKVESEEQLLDIYKKAKDAKIEVHLVTDAGRTEFHGIPTKTCLALGPDVSDKIDPITGNLTLY